MAIIVQSISKRGKKPTEKRLKAESDIGRALGQVEDSFTVRDLSKISKRGRLDTSNILHKMEQLGVVEKVGYKHDGTRGRPEAIYRRV